MLTKSILTDSEHTVSKTSEVYAISVMSSGHGGRPSRFSRTLSHKWREDFVVKTDRIALVVRLRKRRSKGKTCNRICGVDDLREVKSIH